MALGVLGVTVSVQKGSPANNHTPEKKKHHSGRRRGTEEEEKLPQLKLKL